MENFELREKPALSREQKATKARESKWDAAAAMEERRKADEAFKANFARLRAERLARKKCD